MADSGRSGVFVSYRREETGHAAGRLADRIAERFRPLQVFMDVDSIPPGVDFAEAIHEAVSKCHVLLALIGPRWTTLEDARGRRRLDDPEDLVVLELRAALDRRIPVIPVLVDGAKMPARSEVPPGLAHFARYNAVRLNAETFRQDVGWLLEELAKILPPAPPSEAREASPAPPRTLLSRRAVFRLAGGMVAVAASGTAAWEVSRLVGHRKNAVTPPPAKIDAQLTPPTLLSTHESLGDYARYINASTAGLNNNQLAEQGFVFLVRIHLQGDQGRRVLLRWSVIDNATGSPLRDPIYTQDVGPFQPRGQNQERQWPVWVPSPPRRGIFILRATLIDEKHLPLDEADSKPFTVNKAPSP